MTVSRSARKCAFAETLRRLVHLDDSGRVRVLLEIMGTEVAAPT
jgi:hypothetical protein